MIGNKYPPNIQLGSVGVTKIMCGSSQVWPKTAPPIINRGTCCILRREDDEYKEYYKEYREFTLTDGYTGDVCTMCEGRIEIYQKVMTYAELKKLPEYQQMFGWNIYAGDKDSTLDGEYNVLFFKEIASPGYRTATLYGTTDLATIEVCVNNQRYSWALGNWVESGRGARYEFVAIHRNYWKNNESMAHSYDDIPFEINDPRIRWVIIKEINMKWEEERR